jgi:hypothetical protein
MYGPGDYKIEETNFIGLLNINDTIATFSVSATHLSKNISRPSMCGMLRDIRFHDLMCIQSRGRV